ncbi:ERV/ALR sulfhydryl oxidase domain-containing protein [Mycena olivaceomarginata]|nr:ERV/ALR sulfhydryl oxidase domain-containing protein [Mycena olivaceomarginata]
MGESSETKLPPGMNWGKTALAGAAAVTKPSRTQCPPDKDQLGRATWTFLHTAAAYYPTQPTPAQRTQMLALIHALPALYPCNHCAEDFGASVAQSPPDRHNEVAFDCAKTDERWKEGPKDGSCD